MRDFYRRCAAFIFIPKLHNLIYCQWVYSNTKYICVLFYNWNFFLFLRLFRDLTYQIIFNYKNISFLMGLTVRNQCRKQKHKQVEKDWIRKISRQKINYSRKLFFLNIRKTKLIQATCSGDIRILFHCHVGNRKQTLYKFAR